MTFAEMFEIYVLVYGLGVRPFCVIQPPIDVATYRCIVLYGGHEEFAHFQLLIPTARKDCAELKWMEKKISTSEVKASFNYQSHKEGMRCY